MKTKKAVIIHSGGMDSSICLKLAIDEFGYENVLSLSFLYGQRHISSEIRAARKICQEWDVDHLEVELGFYKEITTNALLNPAITIAHLPHQSPNTMVLGRNGIMAQAAAIVAYECHAGCLYMGVIEVEGSNSGYRDCSRKYMDLVESIIRLDLADPHFELRTPLIKMSKKETLLLADQLDVLDYLLEHTVTCYEGISKEGCTKCPACLLKAQGLKEFKEIA